MDPNRAGGRFATYEYKTITVSSEELSLYLDGYESFGWRPDERFSPPGEKGTVTMHLRRDRRLVNRAELTRLQRNFEGCLEELDALERSKTRAASIVSISVGVIGTAFMAGSVFAVSAEPPVIWLCVLLAVPGFVGWALPWALYRWLKRRKAAAVQPWIEKKWEDVYSLMERGRSLL